jgi:putative ABC transport system ATP-binding protein
MQTIIETRDLCKVYRVGNEKVHALDHINLTIGKGEICCILGTSGSGKSTLLNQLAGLERPTSGSVLIGTHNISKMSENQLASFRQKHIGFIFQSYNLLTTMTALENTAAPLLFRGVPKAKREKEAAAILKEVGLGDRMRHMATQMSGGQQQRVGIARAFVAKPTIVFADEPTGNLDSRTTIEVMELLIRLARAHTITFVLVTHDTELAQYADRIITLRDGTIISDCRQTGLAVPMEGEEASAPAQEQPPESEQTVPTAQQTPNPEEDAPLGESTLDEMEQAPPDPEHKGSDFGSQDEKTGGN